MVKKLIYLPCFSLCVSTMGYCNWPLALTSESGKNRFVTGFRLRVVEGSIDNIPPKTLDRMAFQVRGCSSVLGVLEAANPMDTLQAPDTFPQRNEKNGTCVGHHTLL
jgi:hypothetical protein